MSKECLKRLMPALVVLMIAISSQAAEPQSKQKITITYGGEGMHYFPVYLAMGAGFFAQEGLDVEWVNVGSGTRQAASVMGGSAEMSPLALIHVIKSHLQGANLITFSSIFNSYAMPLVLSNEAIQKIGMTPGMPIDEKVKRLKGLQIGITSPGSSTDAFIRNLFLARGMDPDKMVKLQPIGTGTALLAAFEKKLTDGIIFPAPVPQIAEAKGLGKVVIDPFSGEVPELNNVPYVVMATSNDTLKRKPEVIRAATRALVRAMILAHKDPENTRKIMRQYFVDLEEPIYNRALEIHRKGTPETPIISREQIRKQVDWLNLGGVKPLTVKYEGVVATEPAETVAAELLKR